MFIAMAMSLSDQELVDLDRFNELRERARKFGSVNDNPDEGLTTKESAELTILEVKLGL